MIVSPVEEQETSPIALMTQEHFRPFGWSVQSNLRGGDLTLGLVPGAFGQQHPQLVEGIVRHLDVVADAGWAQSSA
jgi:hypothetical protein